jgi:hypothetical protein
VGSLVDTGVPEEHAHVYSEAVRRGGTMVSVNAKDHDVATVHAVLYDFQPLYPMEQREAYRSSGWSAFDPKAGTYESTRTAAERERQTM